MMKKMIRTKYFEAPLSDASPWPPGYESDENHECMFCKQKTNYMYEFEEDCFGCVICLTERKFNISKTTDIGNVNRNGQLYKLVNTSSISLKNILLSKKLSQKEIESQAKIFSQSYKPKILKTPKKITTQQLLEITYTPDISAFQDISHPLHCNDFMKYIGRWEQTDFKKNSIDGDGRALWDQMVEDDLEHLWEETEEEIQYYKNEWPQYETSNWAHGACVYVFECLKCKLRECTWDCD